MATIREDITVPSVLRQYIESIEQARADIRETLNGDLQDDRKFYLYGRYTAYGEVLTNMETDLERLKWEGIK